MNPELNEADSSRRNNKMAERIKKELVFDFDRDTKNTVKFQEEGAVPCIGPLYIQKHALQTLGNANAKKVKVTLELLE
jgi:hypothetical protein